MRVCALIYLGRLSAGRIVVSQFYHPRDSVVVSVLSDGRTTVVQAFKKLVLNGGANKNVDTTQLGAILAAHATTLELRTTKPTPELVERIEPRKETKTRWLEHSLARLDQELTGVRQEYARWRGVRDKDEAHENLANRREEIFDLNQKLIANAREPHFVYAPGKWHPSEWQRTDRVRLNELKDQAKERASAIRSRLDFSYREEIKRLDRKRRELLAEIEVERKRDRATEDQAVEILNESTAAAVLLTVRSRPLLAPGLKRDAVRAATDEVVKDARSLAAKLTERLSVNVQDAPDAVALSALFLPDVSALPAGSLLGDEARRALSLVPRAALEKEVAKVVASQQIYHVALDLSRFPQAGGKRRLAYLGLALTSQQRPTQVPVFFDLDEAGPRHVAVAGGSGSGKSVAASLILEGAALHGVPALVFDPTRSWTGFAQPCSGTMLDRFKPFGLKPDWARGFDVRVLDTRRLLSEGVDVDVQEGITVFTSADVTEEEEATATATLLRSLFTQMNGWSESKRLRLLVVLEEAHRYLRHKTIQPVLEQFARQARVKGVGLLVVSQVAVDLPPAIRNNCATKIQLFTNYAQDLTRAGQVFGSHVQKIIPRLTQARGALHYPEHGTALVAFRPPLHSPAALSEETMQLYLARRDLEEIVATLMTQTPREATATEKPTECHVEPRKEQTTQTWRDVATTVAAKCQTAAEVQEAIRASNLSAPSLRTIQRFLARTCQDSDGARHA